MRLRRSLAAASLAFSAGVVVAGPAPFACAGPGPDATLVIDTGSSEQMLCVALDSSSVSGIRMIELASQQHGISYSLGYGGQAVCMLAGVGSNEEECFEGGQPFWGYWRSNGSSWTWSGTGAGSTVVEDGDVDGWSWGTGNDGGSHQQPPMTSHEAICGPEETEKPDRNGGGSSNGGGGGGGDKPGSGGGAKGADDPRDDSSPGNSSGGTSSPSGEPGDGQQEEQGDGSKDKKQRDDARKKSSTREKDDSGESGASTVASPIVSDPTPSSAPVASSSDAPPVAGVIGLALAVAFGLAGAWFVKRRRIPSG